MTKLQAMMGMTSVVLFGIAIAIFVSILIDEVMFYHNKLEGETEEQLKIRRAEFEKEFWNKILKSLAFALVGLMISFLFF